MRRFERLEENKKLPKKEIRQFSFREGLLRLMAALCSFIAPCLFFYGVVVVAILIVVIFVVLVIVLVILEIAVLIVVLKIVVLVVAIVVFVVLVIHYIHFLSSDIIIYIFFEKYTISHEKT